MHDASSDSGDMRAGDYTLAYLTAGWMAVAAGVVALAMRRAGRSQSSLAPA